MVDLKSLLILYGDTHLELSAVQDDNVFLRGYDDKTLVMVHIKSSNINKSLVIRVQPKHPMQADEWGIKLIKIPIIESVRVLKHGSDKEVIIYIK